MFLKDISPSTLLTTSTSAPGRSPTFSRSRTILPAGPYESTKPTTVFLPQSDSFFHSKPTSLHGAMVFCVIFGTGSRFVGQGGGREGKLKNAQTLRCCLCSHVPQQSRVG